MTRSTEDVKNWMHMFRWIVKLIRDEYGIGESRLTRTAVLETGIGLSIEQIEQVMATIAESFAIQFPADTLDELVRFEDLCMLAAWLKGLYKRPWFVSKDFATRCIALNPALQPPRAPPPAAPQPGPALAAIAAAPSDTAITLAPRPTDGVTNWMNMFRWIVKLIRDDYRVDERRLTRGAVIHRDLGLSPEQLEEVVDTVALSFEINFPDGTLDEIAKLEEFCMVASWLKGLYKRPTFLSPAFEATCRAAYPWLA